MSHRNPHAGPRKTTTIYNLLQRKGAIKLEAKGMQYSRGSVAEDTRRLFGVDKIRPKISREELIEQCQALIDAAKEAGAGLLTPFQIDIEGMTYDNPHHCNPIEKHSCGLCGLGSLLNDEVDSYRCWAYKDVISKYGQRQLEAWQRKFWWGNNCSFYQTSGSIKAHSNPAGDPYGGQAPTHCDLCGTKITTSFIDGKTAMGPWGNMCPSCHLGQGGKLGIGVGQKYVKKGGRWVQAGKVQPKKKSLYDCSTIEEMEDMCGDRDPMDFL